MSIPQPDIIITVRDLEVGYRADSPLLSGVSFDLWAGTLTTLLGANGRGKSTMLRTITGEQPPRRGCVCIDGHDITAITPHRLARLVSIVNTDRHAGATLTVGELVAMGRYPHTGFFGRLGSDDRAICDAAMQTVGIGVATTRRIGTLSDGERQKVMIARAIAQQTPIIILDEPTAFLDVASRIEVMQLLHSLSRRHNRTILLSGHDIPQAMAYSDRLLLAMPDHSLISGTPTELADRPDALPALFAGRPVRFDPTISDFIPGIEPVI